MPFSAHRVFGVPLSGGVLGVWWVGFGHRWAAPLRGCGGLLVRSLLDLRPSRLVGSFRVSVAPRLWVLGCHVGIYGEFDSGSGRTLAACLTHASRTVMGGLASPDQW